jgi:hypothetical protein
VLDSITDQVVDDLAQPFGIGVDDDRITRQQRDRAARVNDAGGLDRLCRDAGQVDVAPVQGAVGVEFGQHEQVLHQPPHPAGLVLDEGHQPQQFLGTGRVALLQAEFGQPPDRCQRGAELMAGVSDKLPHPFLGSERTCLALRARLVGGLDPAEHRVKSIGQPADFSVARRMVDAPRKVTACDCRGRRLDPAERRQAGPDKRQPDACQHRDRDRPSQRVGYLQASDGAVEIIEAERDDRVPSGGQRHHQDPPGMPRRAGRRRGERAVVIRELCRGQPRTGRGVRRCLLGKDLPIGADQLDQELRGQLPVLRDGHVRSLQNAAGDRSEVAELGI